MPAPRKLRSSGSLLVREVQRFVNTRYGGNLRRAARDMGVPYDQLWRATRRTCVRPSFLVLLAVGLLGRAK